MQSIFRRSSSIRTLMCPYHTQSFLSQPRLGTRSVTQVCQLSVVCLGSCKPSLYHFIPSTHRHGMFRRNLEEYPVELNWPQRWPPCTGFKQDL